MGRAACGPALVMPLVRIRSGASGPKRWTRGDSRPSVAALTPLSHWVRGRNEIRRIHASGLATLFRNNVVRYELAAFREIAPGVAVVQVRWQSDGHLARGPRKTTDTRRGIATWTVRGRDHEVEITAAHGTEMLAGPSA